MHVSGMSLYCTCCHPVKARVCVCVIYSTTGTRFICKSTLFVSQVGHECFGRGPCKWNPFLCKLGSWVEYSLTSSRDCSGIGFCQSVCTFLIMSFYEPSWSYLLYTLQGALRSLPSALQLSLLQRYQRWQRMRQWAGPSASWYDGSWKHCCTRSSVNGVSIEFSALDLHVCNFPGIKPFEHYSYSLVLQMLISIVVVLKGVREAIVARNGLPAYFSWAICLHGLLP